MVIGYSSVFMDDSIAIINKSYYVCTAKRVIPISGGAVKYFLNYSRLKSWLSCPNLPQNSYV